VFQLVTQYEAIIAAFQELGGARNANEIRHWVENHYPGRWKDYHAILADMVPVSHGGNLTSTVPEEFRVLERMHKGYYRLIEY